MIKIGDGHGCVDGKIDELTNDFNAIMATLIKNQPAIVIGTLMAWSDIIKDAENNIDKRMLSFINMMSDDFIKENYYKHEED